MLGKARRKSNRESVYYISVFSERRRAWTNTEHWNADVDGSVVDMIVHCQGYARELCDYFVTS
jgi:hypothetical protein